MGSKGVIPGNFYDANGFYLAVTKEFNPKFKLRFTGEYAPVIRAKRSAATKEVYELANDNLYNSYWGYQLGDVRNSRSNTTKIPVFSLNSEYQIKENIKLESGILFLKGKGAIDPSIGPMQVIQDLTTIRNYLLIF